MLRTVAGPVFIICNEASALKKSEKKFLPLQVAHESGTPLISITKTNLF